MNLESFEQSMRDAKDCQYLGKIPEYLLESLYLYIYKGRVVCRFLEAVICNNLVDAFGQADDYNISIMRSYAHFAYHEMPLSSRGSQKAYLEWCLSGGVEGQKEMREGNTVVSDSGLKE